MFEVREITDYKLWENFVLSGLNTLFVQSVSYGEFFKKIGENFWIFGVFQNEQLVSGTLVVSTHAKRGNFLYLPYGPIGDKGIKELFAHLKKFAVQNNFDFIRVSPFWEDKESNKQIFKESGFREAPMHILAENTWILDLEPTEDELLSRMEKTHRYLIKRCQKEGVKVASSTKVENLEAFNKLHDETAKRHKFHRFSGQYIEKEFLAFASNNQSLIFNAYLPDGRLDSSAVIMFYGNMAAYRHGASLGLDNKISTSYLLQWEAIKEAKRRGLKYYNFWGIAPKETPKNHPFSGITHFKKGFGGHPKDLIPCQDLPISIKYWLTWLIETIRRIKRGF